MADLEDKLDREMNPPILWAGFEDAFVGISSVCGEESRAVYDWDKSIQVLVERDGMTIGEAAEYITYNVTGGYLGPRTPVMVHRMELEWAQEIWENG
jgi:hypothetical protein